MIPNRQQDFPNLTDPIHETSPSTPSYNCIAWAIGDSQRWWQSDPFGLYYWPLPFNGDPYSVATLIEAYEAVGFAVCADLALEFRWEKIVIYATGPDEYTHAARQLGDGKWTSKLGEGIDLSHRTPDDLAGPLYGAPLQPMRRRLSFSAALWRLLIGYLMRIGAWCRFAVCLLVTFLFVDLFFRRAHQSPQ